MDIPRIFNITENAHRIHNPFTREKLATWLTMRRWLEANPNDEFALMAR